MIFYSFLSIVFLLGVYAVFVEPFRIKIVEKNIVTSKWVYKKPIKIALIADVHAIWPWMSSAHIKRIIKKTNNQKPDVVLLLGDYVSTHPFGIQPDPNESLSLYASFDSKCGTYSVLGNHDLHGSVGWPEALRKSKIPLLENKATKVICDENEFWIAGLEELWWQNADIEKTLAYVDDNKPVIMMMHNPDSFAEMPEKVTLSVAGHTHAGQIRFPFIGSFESVIPSKYGKRYEHGHIREGSKDLVVSAGLGTTGLPLRFFNVPEIVIINLQSE